MQLFLAFLPMAALGYYSPDVGRWMTRDPLEEKGGLNLHAFCENDPVNKYDPLGEDIYLYTGNNSGNIINDSLHQTVAVDSWSDGCRPVKKGLRGFSFGYIGKWEWHWSNSDWLGYDSLTLPGYWMVGEIYKAPVVGVCVGRKKTTVAEDRKWLEQMNQKVGNQDVYSVGRHNCRNFSQREFDAAPGRRVK